MRHRRFGPAATSSTTGRHGAARRRPRSPSAVDRARRCGRPGDGRRCASGGRDYLDGTDRPLARRARRHRRGASCTAGPTGRIRMLTHLRTWGWLFNPITIYWCDADGRHARHRRARGDQHAVGRAGLVRRRGRARLGPRARCSPRRCTSRRSSAMDLDYRFSFTAPTAGGRLPADRPPRGARPRRKVFDADLSLRRTRAHPRSALGRARAPSRAQTMRISAAIHWQALRLWAKRRARRPPPSTDRPVDTVPTRTRRRDRPMTDLARPADADRAATVARSL